VRLQHFYILLSLLSLTVVSLACGQQVAVTTPTIQAGNTAQPITTPDNTPLPTSPAVATPTAEAETEQAEVRAAVVRVRDAADGEPLTPEQYIYAGQSVTVLEYSDDGRWARIAEPAGWIWAGCLVGAELGCEAMP
jgi:hypothetical protein